MLASRRAGAGPRPLVLLHGFLGSARNLSSLARDLVARRPALSVFALDLAGHGASPPLPPGADLGTLARDVLTTVRALGLPSPLAVAGHSLGGRVALRAGLEAPAVLGHVALLDIAPSAVAPGGEPSRVVEAMLSAPDHAASREAVRAHFLRAGLAAATVEWLLSSLGPEPGGGYGWRIDRRALADLHARTSAEDLWPAVEGPRPYTVACVRGGESPYVGEADTRRLEAAGCPVDTLPGAGHLLHVDRPAELVERLLARLP